MDNATKECIEEENRLDDNKCEGRINKEAAVAFVSRFESEFSGQTVLSDESYNKLQQLRLALEVVLFDETFHAECVRIMKLEITNPAVPFTERARNGDYDDLSDAKYYELLDNCEKESALFDRFCGHVSDFTYDYANGYYELIAAISCVMKIIEKFSGVEELVRTTSCLSVSYLKTIGKKK